MLNYLRKIKRDFLDARDDFRLNSVKKTPSKKVLMYHGVDKKNLLAYNYRHIGLKYFEKHLKLISEKFKVVTPQEYFEDSSNQSLCCITFDDGFQNNLTYASKLLEKYKCPATIYVTTIGSHGVDYLWSDMLDLMVNQLPHKITFKSHDFFKNKTLRYKPFLSMNNENFHDIFKYAPSQEKQEFFDCYKKEVNAVKKDHRLQDYWKLLSPEELRRLTSSGIVNIGSHGTSHSSLGEIHISDAITELSKSKHFLESILNGPVQSIAYPDGSYTSEVIDEAEKIGYKYQFAVNYLQNASIQDERIRDRTGLFAYESLYQQYQKILG